MKDFVEYCKTNEGNLVEGKLNQDDLISFEDMQTYWDEYVKLFIPFVIGQNEMLKAFPMPNVIEAMKRVQEERSKSLIDSIKEECSNEQN